MKHAVARWFNAHGSDQGARKALLEVEDHGIPRLRRGDVHDTFDLGTHLLVVATDRVGVNGVMLPIGIPDKGAIDNQLSLEWFERVAHVCPNHLDPSRELPSEFRREKDVLEPRSVIVRKAEPLPFEFTVRGYMTRRAFEEFVASGQVGGEPVSGMVRSDRLPEPRVTAGKRDRGRRATVSRSDVADALGADVAARVESLACQIYEIAEHHGRTRDVVIAQTALRFGWIDGELHLIGDCITPDTSSYWTAEDRVPGLGPKRLGKGFMLETLTALGWDGSDPGPDLDPATVDRIRERYVEAYRRITGNTTRF